MNRRLVKGIGPTRRAGLGRIALSVVVVCGAPGVKTQAASQLTISAHARAIQPGEVVRLDVRCACAPSPGAGTALVLGREFPLVAVHDPAGWSALIGLDVETAPGDYAVAVSVEATDRALSGTYTLHVASRRFPSRQLRVAPVYVNPPPGERDRILADALRLDTIFKKTTLREGVGPFQAPVGVRMRNTFGARSTFNGHARAPHAGVDFGSPTGTPIKAPAAAAVALADDLFFTGRTVILDHGRGLYSVLAHMSTIAVAEGDVVERGAVVGSVGATGRATGPHLHWGTRLKGARVDPMSLVELLAPRP